MLETLFPLGTNHYIVGGALVGLGIAIPYIFTGLVAGASTVFTSTWSFCIDKSFFQSEKFIKVRVQRLCLVAGFALGGFLYVTFFINDPLPITNVEAWRLLFGGVLAGIGTRMSGGCTSGHSICGLASLEKSSLVATITFLSVAILVALTTAMIF